MKILTKIYLFFILLTITFMSCTSTPKAESNKELKIKASSKKINTVYIETKTKKDVASREKYENATMKIGETDYVIKIKGRGNSSWGQFPKHSYNVKLSEKASLFGFKQNKDWVLVSNYADKSLIRNLYAYYLGQEIFDSMLWNPSFVPVDLYVNGKYEGLYIFGEKIEIAKTRIPLTKNDILIEINRREDEDYNFRTKKDVSISVKNPEKLTEYEKAEIKKLIQDTENAMFSKNFTDIESGYAKYIDIDSFIDWYLINEFAKNVDSAWFSSIYLAYSYEKEKFYFGPLWDYDLGFGNVNYNDCDDYKGLYIQTKSVWFKQLFNDPNFKQKVKERWLQKRDKLEKSIMNQTKKFASDVYASVDKNFTRWQILGIYVWANPAGFENRTTYESEVLFLQNWCLYRYEWLDKEIQSW